MTLVGFAAPDAGGDDQEPDGIAAEPLAVTELGEVAGLTVEQEIRARAAAVMGRPPPSGRDWQPERDRWVRQADLLVAWIRDGRL